MVVILSLLLVAGAAYYGDFLGARFIKKGSPRLSVRQGEINTLELAASPHTRKLEICTEKRNILLGRSDFIECRTLQNFVAPGVTEAAVIIPATMPLGRAIVITRIRDIDGKLIPAAPTDEKITLWIAPPRKLTAASESVTDTVRRAVGGGGSSPVPTGSPRVTSRPTPTATPRASASPSPTRTPSPTPSPSPEPTALPASFRSCSISGDRRSSAGIDLTWNSITLVPDVLRGGSNVIVNAEMFNFGDTDAGTFYLVVYYDKNLDDASNNKLDDTTTNKEGNFEAVAKYTRIAGLKAKATQRFSHTISNTTVTSLRRHRFTIFLDANPPPYTAVGYPIHERNEGNNFAECVFEMYP